MVAHSLWSYLMGYVIIKAKGPEIERLVSQAVASGVPMWDLQRLMPDVLMLRASTWGFRRLRPIARRTQTHLRVIRRVGLPFAIARLARRKMLAAGAAVSLAMVYLLTGIIWFVQVIAPEPADPIAIRSAVAAMGLRPGVPRDRIDPREIEHRLLSEMSALAWADVRLEGTLAVVEVAPKVTAGHQGLVPGDVLAAKDGLVTRVVAHSGYVMVQEGQTVVRNQVLISGRPPEDVAVPGPPGQGPDSQAGGQYVRAWGEVFARTWSEGYGESPLEVDFDRPTGRRARVWELRVGPVRLRRGSGQLPPSSWRLAGQQIRAARIGQRELPVQVYEATYDEVVRERYPVDFADARRLAVERAEMAVRRQLGPGAEQLGRELQVWEESEEGVQLVRARLVVEAIEPIGVFRPAVQAEEGSASP